MRPCFLPNLNSSGVSSYPLNHHAPLAGAQFMADEIDPRRRIHHDPVVEHAVEEFHYRVVFQLAALHHTTGFPSPAPTIKSLQALP